VTLAKTIRVKICCISSVEEAQLAIRYGASALGLVSAMPSGPGPISEELIAAIARTIPPGVASFLLTSKQDAESIIAQQRFCRTNTLQLVDRISVPTYQQLRAELPGVGLVQVIHVPTRRSAALGHTGVTGEESIAEAIAVSEFVDAILLDSGNPSLAVKELGGTGRTHDWSISKRIVEAAKIPVYLAGGLNAENVVEAIRAVRPFGVDLCSGVRTEGKLDEEKLKCYFEEVNSA
jgi:phosphoribosylanthranilate isomerase